MLRKVSAAFSTLVLLAVFAAANVSAATLGPGRDTHNPYGFATFDTALEDGEGNTIGLLLTDPHGVKYSSGIALPILDAPSREVLVKNPVAGQWLVEGRGVRGYVQLALDKGLLQAFFAFEQGPFDFQPVLKARVKANDATTRAFTAYALDNFRQRFTAGN